MSMVLLVVPRAVGLGPFQGESLLGDECGELWPDTQNLLCRRGPSGISMVLLIVPRAVGFGPFQDEALLGDKCIVAESHPQVRHVCLVDVVPVRPALPVCLVHPVHLDLQQQPYQSL